MQFMAALPFQAQAGTQAPLLQPELPTFTCARSRCFSPQLRLLRRSSRRSRRIRCGGGVQQQQQEEPAQQRQEQNRTYPFDEIEPRWQRYWEEHRTFRTSDDVDTSRPKFYILDMFPYPSGAGLHVGHPLGYTATDILARFKRMKGFNVLHPMGWDSFGLPAEQYAIETGTHPKVTTMRNIERFRSQGRWEWAAAPLGLVHKPPHWGGGAAAWPWPVGHPLGGARERAHPSLGVSARADHPAGGGRACGTRWGWPAPAAPPQGVFARGHTPAGGVRTVCTPAGGGFWRRDTPAGGVPHKTTPWGVAFAQADPVGGAQAVQAIKVAPVVFFSPFDCPLMHRDLHLCKILQWCIAIMSFGGVLKWGNAFDFAGDIVLGIEGVTARMLELKSLGFSYDWEREISTTEPDYFKWTQWIFLQLLKKGLAYQAEVPVNWCPALGTVLANEEVVNGVSERGGYPVIRKPMRQWMLKITAYADRLLDDLEDLDWPESIKEMQRNWIGRSEGAELEFLVDDDKGEQDLKLSVYTTRPDTIFGATYLVVAPEHHLLPLLVSEEQRNSVNEYCEIASRKSDLERTELQKEKTGVFSGSYARNPANGGVIPIWVADYVLGSYGTGAIMAVPAHDSRDYEFALKYEIPVIKVVIPVDESCDDSNEPYSDDGVIINSLNLTSGLNINGLCSKEAASKVIDWLESSGRGKKKVNYKLRDWLFARQRYWGEPFPVIFLDDTDEMIPLPEDELPITLPELDDFTPTGTGEPPLAKAVCWVNTIDPVSGKSAKRETSTMPQWAGSCWYYLRFMDPKNPDTLVDKRKEMYWGPVDIYVGGAEHSVLHLLYARFWHKVVFNL
ncbi:hypothetical protein Taro_046658 [Colocasia esculenta]|uniref:leucine--tRNA ligase n=1 Tax=Colocasia esculenta TaxID=4460 RepID=A0A843WQK8_COLES|nr:hypothetical protein [Colocasia esculenta]